MERKKALLLIDPQNDFCDPQNGALGVPGADEDVRKIKNLIEEDGYFDDIYVTMDTHYVIDISHPKFWEGENGEHPDPLTVIKYDDINTKWYPRFYQDWAKRYVHRLEEEGKYDHIIWPEHCIHGSWGHMIQEDVMEGLRNWSSKNDKNFIVIEKGSNILTEHFGAFEAQVPRSGEPETMFNKHLYKRLNEFYDHVHVAGEAESHCVAYTIDQINEHDLCGKLNIHKDFMSPVPGFEGAADSVFDKAEENGANILKS